MYASSLGRRHGKARDRYFRRFLIVVTHVNNLSCHQCSSHDRGSFADPPALLPSRWRWMIMPFMWHIYIYTLPCYTSGAAGVGSGVCGQRIKVSPTHWTMSCGPRAYKRHPPQVGFYPCAALGCPNPSSACATSFAPVAFIGNPLHEVQCCCCIAPLCSIPFLLPCLSDTCLPSCLTLSTYTLQGSGLSALLWPCLALQPILYSFPRRLYIACQYFAGGSTSSRQSSMSGRMRQWCTTS